MAKTAFMAAAFATAIGAALVRKREHLYCLFYDATLYGRHRVKNLSPHPELFDSLDQCFDACHCIVWANLSYVGMDTAKDIDAILQRRFSAGLANIVSGWHQPQVLATKDSSLANMANPYPLLHERASDARMVYRCVLPEEKA